MLWNESCDAKILRIDPGMGEGEGSPPPPSAVVGVGVSSHPHSSLVGLAVTNTDMVTQSELLGEHSTQTSS